MKRFQQICAFSLAALTALAACSSGSTSNGSTEDASLRPIDQGGVAGTIPTGGNGGGSGSGGSGGVPVGGAGGVPAGGQGGEPTGGQGGGGQGGGGAGGAPVDLGVSGGQAVPADVGITVDLLPDLPPAPDLGRLVINEVDYDQTSADTAEYIELYNAADAPARLRGKRLELVNGSNQEVYTTIDLGLAGAELAAHGYLIIGAAEVLEALPEGTLSLPLEGGIQNGAPDGARVVDALVVPELTVDGVAWEGSLANVGEGDGAPADIERGPGAIGRCPNAQDTDDNAADFVAIVNSPGAENVCPPPAPRTLTLTLEPASVPARSAFQLTVGLDLPAGFEGLPLVFDFTPATGARGPEAGTIEAGELEGTFDFFAGPTPGMVHLVVESPDLNLSAETDFEVLAPLPVERVPLVINEVDVDQPGIDDGEYVEIHNPTDSDAPLVALEVEFVNGSTGMVYDHYPLEVLGETLPAGGYLVIGDAELIADLPIEIPAIELSGSLLNDTGHAVRLVDLLSGPPVVLDSVAFGTDPARLGEGLPTRVRDSGGDAVYTLARCPNGGDTGVNGVDFAFARPTLGAANDCLPPVALTLMPPQILVGAPFEAQVELAFPAPAGGTALTFEFAPAGGPGATCADAVIAEGSRLGVVDCVGPAAAGNFTVAVDTANGSATAALSVIEAPPVPAHPIINEVDYDQSATDTADFIEILNPTEAAIDLDSFSVQIINGSDGAVIDEYDLSLGADRLPPGGTLVIGMDAALAALPAGTPAIPMSGATETGLQNGPDAVRLVLRRPGGVEFVDGLAYEAAAPDAGEGNPPPLADAGADLAFSLGRCPNGADTDDNATDFRLGLPSPGAPNLCPAALSALVDPAQVVAGQRFTIIVSLPVPRQGGDLPLVLAQAPIARVNCPADAVIADGGRSTVLDCVAGDVAGEVALTITAGALRAEATVTVQARPAGRGGLVINEVDPDQSGADNGEFFELFNTGDAPVRLDGLVVELVNGANGDVYATINLSAAGPEVPAHGYLVVTREQGILNALPAGTMSLRNGAALQNDADGLRLVDQNAEVTLDGISYGTDINGVTEGRFAPNDNGFAASLGRCPNGLDTEDNARDFAFGAPTPGAVNTCPN